MSVLFPHSVVFGGLVMDSIQDALKDLLGMEADIVLRFASMLGSCPKVVQEHLQSSLFIHTSRPKAQSEDLSIWQCTFPAALMHVHGQRAVRGLQVQDGLWGDPASLHLGLQDDMLINPFGPLTPEPLNT
jgi:hypothetical protein